MVIPRKRNMNARETEVVVSVWNCWVGRKGSSEVTESADLERGHPGSTYQLLKCTFELPQEKNKTVIK
jgi:hypothetical protein